MSGPDGEFGSDVADPGLAEAGLARIAWAERAMPLLGLLREEAASKRPFAGRSIAACLHITAETAVLVDVITAGGGRVHLAASNPLSTQDDVAAALGAAPFRRQDRLSGSSATVSDRPASGSAHHHRGGRRVLQLTPTGAESLDQLLAPALKVGDQ
jgi:S-adenosyl-L-homocysteine hydrolase